VTSSALFWLGLLGLTLASLAATGSRALLDMSWHELEELCRRRRRRELFDQILDHHDDVALGVECVRILGGAALVAALAGWLVTRSGGTVDWPAAALTIGLGSLLLVVFAVWIPWGVVAIWPAPYIYYTWRLWRAVYLLTLPLLWGMRGAEWLLHRLAGRTEQPSDEEAEEAFEDEIRTMVTEGERDGHLEADAREMIEGVIELGDVDVSDIMTPRSRMDVLPIDMPFEKVVAFVANAGRTRIPVYGKTLDDIVGVLYVKDLLVELVDKAGAPHVPWQQLLRKPWFVPQTQKVDELLQAFLRNRNHLAIVVDEYLATTGLVTIEDALEEIVGEIVDESDHEADEEIVPVDDHTAEIQGTAHLEDINERLGFDLPEPDEFDTIAGFVVNQIGEIPKPGRSLTWNKLRITVLEASRRRVERVRVERVDGNGAANRPGRGEGA